MLAIRVFFQDLIKCFSLKKKNSEHGEENKTLQVQVSPNGTKIVIQLLFPKAFIVKGFLCFLLGQNVYMLV